MAQNLASVKSNFISGCATLADQLLTLSANCDEIAAHFFAMGYNSGGANQLVDADCQGANAYLTAAIVSSLITQFQAVSAAMTSGARNVLRQGIQNPLP